MKNRLYQYLFKPREFLSRHILRCVIKHPHISIISDDCWGAEYYRELRLPYLTPTIGAWIKENDYLSFIANLKKNLHSELIFISSDHTYPVATLNNHTIYFMHFSDENEAYKKWFRRCKRIDWNHLFYKVDFGRAGFTENDLDIWNKLALPNSIAFLNEKYSELQGKVHNGIYIPDWVLDGAAMYDISKQYFSLWKWINEGKLNKTMLDSALDVLLFDRRLKLTIKKLIKNN